MSNQTISGQYKGTYNIVVRSAEESNPAFFKKAQAFSGTADDPLGTTAWEWDFDNMVVKIDNGRLTPEPDAPPLPIIQYFDYAAYTDDTKQSQVLSVVHTPEPDNENIYTVSYYWTVTANMPFSQGADTNIKLEITQLKDGSIAIVTVAGENGIPGTVLPDNFPHKATPDWRGRATKS